MKKFASINKKSSQLFLTKRAQTLLKMASIYDESGDYKMAEAIQNEAFKYSKYIKIAEDLSEDNENINDEDVDIIDDIENVPTDNLKDFINSITHPELRSPFNNSLDSYSSLGLNRHSIQSEDLGVRLLGSSDLDENEHFSEFVKLIISWLAPGGNSVYKSLISLSQNYIKNMAELENLDFTLELNMPKRHLKEILANSKALKYSLAVYFKTPGFIFSNINTLLNQLKEGNITPGSVETIKFIINEDKQSASDSIGEKQKIAEALPELPSDPELSNKIISFLYRKYLSYEINLEEIKDIDVKKLSLAIIHGNDNFQNVNIKYEALTYLPENLVLSIIDKTFGVYESNMEDSINLITGFKTKINYKSPVFNFLRDYLAKHPEVGKIGRLGYPTEIPYNELMFFINTIPPDKVDGYIRGDFYTRSKSKIGYLGRFLFEQGILPDYETVCEEIENILRSSHPWSNLNYYIAYKANKEKATKVFQILSEDDSKKLSFENVNLTIIDPNDYLDFILLNSNNTTYDFDVNELSLLYAKLGNKIFKYPPVLLKDVCKNISKTINFDNPEVYEFADKVLEKNPDFSSFSSEDQQRALMFYSRNVDYFDIPFRKILNFTEFTKISDLETASNHLFLFENLASREWIQRTPRFVSYSSKKESMREIGNQIQKDGFLLGSLKFLIDNFSSDHLDQEHKSRPIQEYSIAINNGNNNEAIKERLELIDQVKESIIKASKINPEYADLIPGSRDYYYIVNYLCDNYSLRGQSVKSFLLLRDSQIKALFLKEIINQNEKLSYTIISRLGLNPSFENYICVNNLIKDATQLSRNRYGNESLVIGLSNFVSNHIENGNFNYNKLTDTESRNTDILRSLSETINLPNLPEIDLVNSLDIEVPNLIISKYDESDKCLIARYNKIANTVSIFGRLLNQVLDKFARVYCKSSSVKDLNSVPNDQFNDLIELFFDNLPMTQQNYVGFAQFYINRLGSVKDLGQIKRIGESWNKNIKIFDENNRIVGTDVLKNIAFKYSFEDLLFLLQMTSFSNIYENYENADKNFLKVYCRYDSACKDKEEYDEEEINELYPIREKVYLDGLNVPLPHWASFRKTIEKPGTKDKITLRFLPRDDARGLYLGVIASCCQHFDGEAALCAVDGQVNPKAAFMVFELNNELIAECYTWEDSLGNICLDSFETIGNEAYHSDTNKQIIEDLIWHFGNNQPDILVTIGSNKFNFKLNRFRLRNPSEYYRNYLDTTEYTTFYRDDHSEQDIVSDKRKKQHTQDEYDLLNPIDYFEDRCFLCGNNSLVNEEKCLHCGYESYEYTKCPECDQNTVDNNGRCQNMDCYYSEDNEGEE